MDLEHRWEHSKAPEAQDLGKGQGPNGEGPRAKDPVQKGQGPNAEGPRGKGHRMAAPP